MIVEVVVLTMVALAFITWPLVDLYRAGRRYRDIGRELDAITRGDK